MLERALIGLLFCIGLEANRPALQEQNRLPPVLPCRSSCQAVDIAGVRVLQYCLKAGSCRMVRLVNDYHPVVFDEVRRAAFAIQRLNHRDIHQPGAPVLRPGILPYRALLLLPAAFCSPVWNLVSYFKEPVQFRLPLVEQVLAVHQHQSAHRTSGNQVCANDRLPRSGCSGQHTLLVLEHSLRCLALVRRQFPTESDIERSPVFAIIGNHELNPSLIQQIGNSRDSSSGQDQVLVVLLGS